MRLRADRRVRHQGRLRRWAPAVYPALLTVLTVVQAVAPQRDGPLALAQVFAPWLFLPLVGLLPHLVLLRDRRLAVALIVVLAAGAVRFGPGLVPAGDPAPAPDARTVRVVSWNVLLSNPARRVTATVRTFDADVVGLVEVTRRQAATLGADPVIRARYPTLLLFGKSGRALLSRYPEVDAQIRNDPSGRPGSSLLLAHLDLGGGRQLAVVVAHPLPALAAPSSDLPLTWDATPRDAEIGFVRSVVDAEVAAGHRVVLMGDFNVTDREPGGRELTRGLTDAHATVGWGPGASWAPIGLRKRGVALVRIDRVLGGPGVVPTAFDTDCTFHGSDHCVLHATVAVDP